ncbi:MAG: acyl-CoA dehydrogenase [Candidatus Marinimicrobia bacterium]|jgi:alkylation response protein AidB-like acyl-CoA dehydrogenase|nr:acyl-CoA dehydrogenase [Candidatus Neomarinimicrobiota bacterium]MBT3618750.1 acyl-CoA dehydrogenase [Candidatus Neomarinimicrobiota bacterium]MBT3828317.1 acyl-CoA dehydrogenase [Candidatus Neomarinimicrobiota bacterium]MBT3997222.1 acyl-CoA dehydrogenase [Candidatus Neomarinimicrobiota bacterium]MBT4280180.1 acyl-CoA dehydrogenase [Candidatus Neomarinimicrobiota bacterium]
MENSKTSYKTGGTFLVEPITNATVFSRENFSDEHREIYEMVKEFDRDRIRVQKEEIEKFDKNLSLSLIKEMGELGLLGIDIPEKYGGIELDKVTTAIVAEALVSSPSFATTWAVQTGIGSLPIVWFGTPEQKAKFLPKVGSGEIICAYGLTESSAGSDALAGKTSAVLTDDGEYYVLNGEKIFISNGGWADLFIVFAQVDGDKFTAFIVERETEGFTIGAEEKKMGMKGSSTTSLIFQNAKIPVNNLLYKVGKGATIAFNVLNIGRFKLGSAGVGGAKMAIEVTAQYARDRRAFGKPISQFDAIIKKIADMTVRTFAADSMLYRTIGLLQNEIDSLDKSDPDYYIHFGEAMEQYAIETSMAKVYGSETSHFAVNEGLQVFGGYGFLEEYPMASAYRDDRINQIWEGTNEINRQIITGFMMKKALMEELPIREAITSIDSFLTNEKLEMNSGPLSPECDTIETGKRLALYIFNEALNKFGQDLKHEQQITEIFADIFMDLYTAEATVVRAQKIMENENHDRTVCSIAKIFTAEMVLRLLNMSLTALNGIYGGHTTPEVIDRLRHFQGRMLLPTDIINLKREVAKRIYQSNQYPF